MFDVSYLFYRRHSIASPPLEVSDFDLIIDH